MISRIAPSYGAAIVAWLLSLAAFAAGCGESDETESTPPDASPPIETCDAGLVRVDEACVCPPGSLETPEGACRAAGIDPALCGAGFQADGAMGCAAILPPEPCAPGTHAVPGDSACHPVANCPSGPWPDLSDASEVVYVDASYTAPDADGTEQRPWPEIQSAIDAAPDGAVIAIAEGSYHEDVAITGKAMRLRGVCADRVEIVGSGLALAAVLVTEAEASEVRGVAVRGSSNGIAISGAQPVVDEVWIHDTAGRGLIAQGTLGPTHVVLRRSLIEKSREIGVFAAGCQIAIEDSTVRDTRPTVDKMFGRGLDVLWDPLVDASTVVELRGSVVERNADGGLVVSSADALVERSVIRDTLPRSSDGTAGNNVVAQLLESGPPAHLAMSTSLVERGHTENVVVFGAEATIETTVLRGALPRESDQWFGVGISVQPLFGTSGAATVRSSVVEQNETAGILVIASQATIESTIVRDTSPPAPPMLQGGSAVEFQFALETGVPSVGQVVGSVLERSHLAGIAVVASDVSVTSTAIRDVAADPATNGFGDGIAIESRGIAATGIVERSSIERCARAGIVTFGASLDVGDTTLSCNAFDLDAEPVGTFQPSFTDRGGNQCGCEGKATACVALSAGLTPPAPVGP